MLTKIFSAHKNSLQNLGESVEYYSTITKDTYLIINYLYRALRYGNSILSQKIRRQSDNYLIWCFLKLSTLISNCQQNHLLIPMSQEIVTIISCLHSLNKTYFMPHVQKIPLYIFVCAPLGVDINKLRCWNLKVKESIELTSGLFLRYLSSNSSGVTLQ